jgi:hypothetical protein
LAFLQTPQILLAQGIPNRWEARRYRPPSGIGAPRRTEGGGTRSGGGCPVTDKPLTALVPSDRFGTTVAAYPKFFVYMPATLAEGSPLPVEFVLTDASGNTLYKSTFKTTGKPGILTIALPTQAGLPPLAVGQDYKWSFSIICGSDERSLDLTVGGGIRRVELNPTLANQLQQASPEKQVQLYAEAEVWQDTLATLAQLRRDYPNDAAIASEWEKLMSAVGLSDIAQESLLPTSTLTGGQISPLQSRSLQLR